MFVVRTTKHPAHPLGKLVRPQQTVRLDNLALCVDPLRHYGVRPRTLPKKKTTHDSHSLPALLSLSFNPKSRGSASAMDRGDGWEHDGAPWTLRPNTSTPCGPSAARSTDASSAEPMPSSSLPTRYLPRVPYPLRLT